MHQSEHNVGDIWNEVLIFNSACFRIRGTRSWDIWLPSISFFSGTWEIKRRRGRWDWPAGKTISFVMSFLKSLIGICCSVFYIYFNESILVSFWTLGSKSLFPFNLTPISSMLPLDSCTFVGVVWIWGMWVIMCSIQQPSQFEAELGWIKNIWGRVPFQRQCWWLWNFIKSNFYQ